MVGCFLSGVSEIHCRHYSIFPGFVQTLWGDAPDEPDFFKILPISGRSYLNILGISIINKS
jgi:hypothetical protein